MQKQLYVWLYAAPLGIGLFLLILSGIIESVNPSANNEPSPITAGAMGIGVILLFVWFIVHIVFYFLLIAKMWGAIQDGETEMSVGKAIGFLFIPIFGIFWVFKVWGGYPSEYNAYAARNNLSVPDLSNGIFIAVPIVLLLTSVYIGFLALPFVMIAAIIKVSDALNALENAPVNTNDPYFSPPPPPSSLNLNQ